MVWLAKSILAGFRVEVLVLLDLQTLYNLVCMLWLSAAALHSKHSIRKPLFLWFRVNPELAEKEKATIVMLTEH